MTFPYTEEQFRKKVASAAAFYWKTRRQQAASQKKRGVKDAGSRGQVTGGRHLDGFARLIQEICIKAGFTKAEVFFDRAVPVPGYYRPQKNWDVVVMRDGRLVAAIELKSQSGSFGNNFNNRTEEVLGVSRDFWVAYRERVFGVTEAPWLGYLFFLEDSPSSERAVALRCVGGQPVAAPSSISGYELPSEIRDSLRTTRVGTRLHGDRASRVR